MIFLLLPAYNEERSLPRLVPKFHAAMAELGQDYRIIVVNDGSVDGTAEVLEDLGREYPIDVVTHEINRGLGETSRDAFEHAARLAAPGDIMVRMDCDDTHEPIFIRDLLRKLDEGYHVVSTSRFQPGGGQLGVSTYRAFISRCANIFMSIVFPIRGISDYSCGFRAYRASVIQDALAIFGNSFIQLKGVGFTCTLEKLVKLNLMGCRFAEVPFTLRYDQKASESKMVTSVTTLGYFTMMILHHWPFGGWRSQYRQLARRYQENREAVLAAPPRRRKRVKPVSQVSF